jgi:hypothetical protein
VVPEKSPKSFAHMSIKKIGQGGEYLYFSVKKKFYSLVFFVIKIVCGFAGFFPKIKKIKTQFVLY